MWENDDHAILWWLQRCLYSIIFCLFCSIRIHNTHFWPMAIRQHHVSGAVESDCGPICQCPSKWLRQQWSEKDLEKPRRETIFMGISSTGNSGNPTNFRFFAVQQSCLVFFSIDVASDFAFWTWYFPTRTHVPHTPQYGAWYLLISELTIWIYLDDLQEPHVATWGVTIPKCPKIQNVRELSELKNSSRWCFLPKTGHFTGTSDSSIFRHSSHRSNCRTAPQGWVDPGNSRRRIENEVWTWRDHHGSNLW